MPWWTLAIVAGRAEDVAPLQALHRHLRAALARRNPITGLCDVPEVVAFAQLVVETPALAEADRAYELLPGGLSAYRA